MADPSRDAQASLGDRPLHARECLDTRFRTSFLAMPSAPADARWASPSRASKTNGREKPAAARPSSARPENESTPT